MPAVKIPFHVTQASGQEERGGAPPLSLNALVDGVKWISVFPGSSAWSLFPESVTESEVIGITDWNGVLVYVTADRKIYSLDQAGNHTQVNTSSFLLEGSDPPVFAKTQGRLFIAGGGRISHWDGPGTVAVYITDADAPRATHVVAVVNRIVAPALGTGDLCWTDVGAGNHLTGWRALNSANAEARDDIVLALHENARQIFAFGPETLQAFEPDPSVDFIPLQADNEGLFAKHSVINLLRERAFAWFTPNREFVVGNGRGKVEVISKLLASTLQDLESPEDCRAYRILWKDHELLIWRFIAARRTFCFDVTHKRFLELGARDANGQRINWPVTAYHFWPDLGVHLIGREDGQIQVLDEDATTLAGKTLDAEIEVGEQDHASDAMKATVELRVAAKRGVVATDSTPPWVTIGYRDRPGPWREFRFSLGDFSDTKSVVRRRIVGKPYPRRSWFAKIPAGHKLGTVEELFEPLEE